MGSHSGQETVEFTVLEYPQAAPRTVRPLDLKEIPPPPEPEEVMPKRTVFGLSKRTLTDSSPGGGTSETDVNVKAGNTLAVAPDDKELLPGDEDSLPIPTEEYLVTAMPSILTEARIPYPKEAREKEIEGPVVMDILIDQEGNVREALLIDGPDPSLNQAALEAAKEMRFQPARVKATPVAVRIRYTYRFVLES